MRIKSLEILTEIALFAAILDDELKANFNPNQPRVPDGYSNGGQWTDGGGSYGSPSKRPAKPIVAEPLDDGHVEPVYPVESAIGALFGGQIFRIGKIISDVIENEPAQPVAKNAEVTIHGAERATQRKITTPEVQEAIKSGTVTTKIGKYGTPQNIYKGKNGVTVVAETSGRNAGKIVTVWRGK